MCCLVWVYVPFAQSGDMLNLQKIDNQLYHFGYYLGANYNTFSYEINTKARFNDSKKFLISNHFGFEVGMLVNVRLHKLLDIRLSPGVSYFQRDLIYSNEILESYKKTYPFIEVNDTIRQVNSTYLNMPLAIKFNAIRLYNYRPYLITSVCYSYDFSSNQDSQSDNFQKVFRTAAHRFSYGFGFGIEFYCLYFKMSTQINTSFGLNNVLIKDGKEGKKESPWTDSFSQLKVRETSIKVIFQ